MEASKLSLDCTNLVKHQKNLPFMLNSCSYQWQSLQDWEFLVIGVCYFSGVTPEQVGQTAAEMLLRNVDYGGCCDEYLQDQVRVSLNSIIV